MIRMIKIFTFLLCMGCSQPAVESWKAGIIPPGKLIIVTPKARPKTFIEKTWPRWEKLWPSNRKPMNTPWRKPPLQVV